MKKNKTCRNKGCDNVFMPFNSLQKYCSYACKKANIKPYSKKTFTPIRKKSKKRQKEEAVYLKKRADFLNLPENKKCPVFPQLYTTDVHHKKGRIGYADKEARLKGITLYLDERYWLAVSRKGHRKIEESPEWAKKQGYSLNRL